MKKKLLAVILIAALTLPLITLTGCKKKLKAQNIDGLYFNLSGASALGMISTAGGNGGSVAGTAAKASFSQLASSKDSYVSNNLVKVDEDGNFTTIVMERRADDSGKVTEEIELKLNPVEITILGNFTLIQFWYDIYGGSWDRQNPECRWFEGDYSYQTVYAVYNPTGKIYSLQSFLKNADYYYPVISIEKSAALSKYLNDGAYIFKDWSSKNKKAIYRFSINGNDLQIDEIFSNDIIYFNDHINDIKGDRFERIFLRQQVNQSSIYYMIDPDAQTDKLKTVDCDDYGISVSLAGIPYFRTYDDNGATHTKYYYIDEGGSAIESIHQPHDSPRVEGNLIAREVNGIYAVYKNIFSNKNYIMEYTPVNEYEYDWQQLGTELPVYVSFVAAGSYLYLFAGTTLQKYDYTTGEAKGGINFVVKTIVKGADEIYFTGTNSSLQNVYGKIKADGEIEAETGERSFEIYTIAPLN